MKDYKIKENLCNLKQSVDALKAKVVEMDEKFEVLLECLDQKSIEEENIGGTD